MGLQFSFNTISVHSFCRFCTFYLNAADADSNSVHILGTPGLKEKIQKYFLITVSKDDALPKRMCKACYDQLNAFDARVRRARELHVWFSEELEPTPIAEAQSPINKAPSTTGVRFTETNGNERTFVTDTKEKIIKVIDYLTKDLKSSPKEESTIEPEVSETSNTTAEVKLKVPVDHTSTEPSSSSYFSASDSSFDSEIFVCDRKVTVIGQDLQNLQKQQEQPTKPAAPTEPTIKQFSVNDREQQNRVNRNS